MNKCNFSEISVLNNLESIVFIADSSTKKIIFTNDYTKNKFGIRDHNKCFHIITGDYDLISCPFENSNKCCGSKIQNNFFVSEYFNRHTKSYYEIRAQQKVLDDGKEAIIGMMIDLTTRKQYEEALKYNEYLFRSIFESYIDVFFQATLNGMITIVSPSCLQLTGYDSDELLNVNLASLLIDENASTELISEILSVKVLRDKQLNLIQKDSQRLPVSLDCRLVYDSIGDPIQIEGTIKDNTSRIQAEDKLKEAAERAIEAQKMRNEFIANMNHELRTPLNGILGYTQILKSDEEITDKQLSGIEIIERSANHLLGLINDILDLSKIEADKMEFQYATFNFPQFIKTIYEMISVRARNKRIGVVLNRKTDLPEILIGDKKRLGQVLLNLLTNAVKFTDFGTVTFSVSYYEGKALFEVSDTGFGIPEDKIESIFLPFNQLSEHTQKAQGTGLGLSISQKIVNKLGGNITVESELGRGSKFRFEISMKTADEKLLGSINLPNKIVGYDGEIRKILIVDDEVTDRKLLKAFLHPKGFELVEATDGIDVLKIVEKEIPDLILLDLLMPQLDGYELTKELRSNESTKNIPIIIITAFDPKEIEEKFTELNVSDIILKPVEEKLLMSVIQKVINISWNYLNGIGTSFPLFSDTTVESEIISYPDIEIISELNKLVNRRNFSKLHENLDKIEQENKSFIPFVKKIKKLANSFNSNLIRKELAKIIEEIDVPADEKI